MKIGICDDMEIIHKIMSKYIQQYVEYNNISIDITSYESGDDLISSKDYLVLDILFLDIHMPDQDGIEVGKQLQKEKSNCRIVILTGMTECFKEAFKIGAFRFVTKPIDKKEVFEVIDDVRKRMLGLQVTIVYQDGRAYEILQKDICYVEAGGNQTQIYTKTREFRSEKSLSDWEKELDNRLFVRTHRTFLVNVSIISSIDKRIYLYTGDQILLSKRQKKKVEEAYLNYDLYYR